jgi:protein phosphatase 2C family protein 2/3
MEDSHTVHLYLPPGSAGYSAKSPADNIKVQPPGCTVTNDDEGEDGPALFGVFDGHGGSSAAKFAGTTMHTRLRGLDAYSERALFHQLGQKLTICSKR